MAISLSASSTVKLDEIHSKGELPRKDDTNIRCVQFMGYRIFIGRNALSNEKLISQHEHKNCLWFHVSCAKGAHVVLCLNGHEEPEELVLRRAAGLALQFSKSPSKEVTYAPLIDVFRPEHANPGVFMTWRTDTITL